jgi:hypothetical protein
LRPLTEGISGFRSTIALERFVVEPPILAGTELLRVRVKPGNPLLTPGSVEPRACELLPCDLDGLDEGRCASQYLEVMPWHEAH